MKTIIILLMTAIMLCGAIVNTSAQDVQRVMRTQRARRTRREKTNPFELFMDY